jgi:hypothetical protein
MGQGTGSALLFEILNRIQITVPPHVMLGFALASAAGRNRHQHSLSMRKGLTGRALAYFVVPLLSSSWIGGNPERGLLPFPSIKAIQRVSHRVDKDADHAIHGGPIGEVSSNK